MPGRWGQFLALTLATMAESLSVADGLPRLGTRREPMSSMRRTRATWLLALCMRLSITLGVGGRQGVIPRGVVGGVGVGGCLLRLVVGSTELPLRLPVGLLVESRLVI